MEISSQVGRWTFRFDRDLTAALHREASPIDCNCDDCINFRTAKERAYSPQFLQLLEQLGIDPFKPAELCHYGTSGEPMPTQGWFHFVGHLDAGDDAWRQVGDTSYTLYPEPFPGMKSVGFSSRIDQARDSFAGHPLVQLEFETVVPWVTEVPPQ